jgi:hypothetical protein
MRLDHLEPSPPKKDSKEGKMEAGVISTNV